MELNDCVSFGFYMNMINNLRNGMAERNVIGQNGTLTLTLCLTIIPTLTLTIFLNLTQPYPNQPTNQPSTGQSQCVPPFRSFPEIIITPLWGVASGFKYHFAERLPLGEYTAVRNFSRTNARYFIMVFSKC